MQKDKFDDNQIIRKKVKFFLSKTNQYTPRVKIDACRDQKDNFILELAETCKAKYIITGDKDLLVLKEWKECKIITLREFKEL